MSLELPPCPEVTQTDTLRRTYIFLSEEVLHFFLSRLTEGVGLEGGEAVIYSQVDLSHSEERAEEMMWSGDKQRNQKRMNNAINTAL